MKYPLVETFYSIQGEGFYSGAPAFFVRLFGCPIKCPWCDTKNSWQGEAPLHLTPEEIAQEAASTNCEFAVITGGEPTIHKLNFLVNAFHRHNIPVHLETSGYMPKEINFDWITLSPKLSSHTNETYILAADEFKFVVSNVEEINAYTSKFTDYIYTKKAVFITPESSKMNDKNLLHAICEFVKQNGHPFRTGIQLHKIFNVI